MVRLKTIGACPEVLGRARHCIPLQLDDEPPEGLIVGRQLQKDRGAVFVVVADAGGEGAAGLSGCAAKARLLSL